MGEPGRPGPKPHRLYLRTVRVGDPDRDDLPPKREVTSFITNLERVGRLVAHGELVEPPGDLLVVRAADLPEAVRVLRRDPFRNLPDTQYDIVSWHPITFGSGVNLEPPPARGSGRLTALQRVAVFVRDQNASLAWYRGVLGLTVRENDRETGYVELALGRGAAALTLVSPQTRWGEPYYAEAMARVGTRTGIAFETDSVSALSLRLRHAGAVVTQEPERQPWGGTTLRFVDPDGNEFLAFERRPGAGHRPSAA